MTRSSTLALLTLWWGTLAFGGVYPWTFAPLVTLGTAAGLLALAERWAWKGWRTPLAAACALLWVATLVQAVPIPRALLAWVSPATDLLLQRISLSYALASQDAGSPAWHALSLRPLATAQAALFLAILGTFVVGLSSATTNQDARKLAGGITVLAAVVAVFGLCQRTLFDTTMFGFWKPEQPGASPFGPFANRNHFAGWMLMATPVAISYVLALATAVTDRIPRTRRARLRWLGSSELNRLIRYAALTVLMTLSLALTTSRSGLAALAVSSVAALCVFARHTGRLLRVATLLGLVACAGFGITCGAGVFLDRLSTIPSGQVDGRFQAWQDTLAIVRDFPLTGAGLNTFSTTSLIYQRPSDRYQYLAAHNEYLQLAAEGGLLLLVPFVIVSGVFLREVARQFRNERPATPDYFIRAGATIGLLAIALQSIVEFSLQIPANAFLFCALAVLACRQADTPRFRV